MYNPVLARPQLDLEGLVRILRGEWRPKRVTLVELFIDNEVRQPILE